MFIRSLLKKSMAQACLTQYFTPKRSRHSSTILANGESTKSQKRKLKLDEENNENVYSLSTKKRRISPTKPTDGYLPGCDLGQIDKLPLSRKNRSHDTDEEKKVKTFERQKQCLAKVADIDELRKHLKAVRTHIDQAKETTARSNENEKQTTTKFVPAHERFAHLLVEKPSVIEPSSTPTKNIASPADLRRFAQISENERLKKVLSKVDQTMMESLPTTPSKRITGINSRLLEQIRLKEESRTQLISLENTGVIQNEQHRSKTHEMFLRMREALDIIDQLFTTERQVALEYDRVWNKIMELHSARLKQDQANEILDFIVKSINDCAYGYLISLKLRNKQYIKINRTKISSTSLSEYIEKKLLEYGE